MSKEQKIKKKFVDPIIKKVPLAIEEAVLAGCKTGTSQGTGPGFQKCEENIGMGTKVPCNAFAS